MELKPGYKLTEVGVIPEDWNLLKIADVVENNRLPSGLYKEKSLYGHGNRIIKISDVFNFDYFEPEQAQRVVLNKEEISKYCAKNGDIFIALASVKLEGVGKVMLVKDLDEDTAFDHNVALIRSNERIFPDFLFYLLKSNIIRRQVGQSATQVGTTFLKASTILAFQLPAPIEKTEQRLIASTLSDMDELLGALDRLIAKKRDLKQAAMQQLLTGKTRLPGFGEGKSYQQTEIGVIPDDWKISELTENARVIDSLHKTPDFCADGYPMVRVADIKPGNLHLQETLKVCSTVFEEFTRNYRPKRGDIVLSRVGSYGISSFVETDEPLCLGQNTVVIEPWIPSRFLYYALNSKYIREQIENESYGSGYKSLSLRNIKELIIAVPPTVNEQDAIATVLSDMDAEIAALVQRRDKTRALKQGLMQELLTGRIRLV